MTFEHSDLQSKIKELYKLYFGDVAAYVMNNSGQMDDAKDLFQDVVMGFLKVMQSGADKNVQNEKYYLLGMARNIWLKKLKKDKNLTAFDDYLMDTADDNSELENEKDSLLNLISIKLSEISVECRKIIYEGFYLKRSNPELAALTGYTEQFIKVKKHRCLQALKKLVMNSPDQLNFQNAN